MPPTPTPRRQTDTPHPERTRRQPPTTTAEVGHLHLVHLNGAVLCLAFDCLRSECDVPRAPGEREHARTHERQARHHRLPRLRRMVPAVGPIGFSMRSTVRCCMRAWARCGASSSTGALGRGWRRGMAPRRARLPPSSRCTLSAGRGAAGGALSLAGGDTAVRRNAPHEAMVACTTGLTLLVPLPASPERSQRELALLLTLQA